MIFSSTNRLLAVADGEVLPLQSPDTQGANEISGYAVEPVSGTIYSPVSGRVEGINDSRQLYKIRSDDGLEVYVHVGESNMDLGNSSGIISLVEKGDDVRAGDIIAKADLALIKLNGYSATTPVIISEPESLHSCEIKTGWVRGGRSAVLRYKKHPPQQ